MERGEVWLNTDGISRTRIGAGGWSGNALVGRILLASVDRENAVRIRNPVTETLIREIDGGEHVTELNALAFSPGANLLAGAFGNGAVVVWDLRTGESAR
jgi:WD40 repeat protein